MAPRRTLRAHLTGGAPTCGPTALRREYTSDNTLALEMVPRERRGFVGGILQGARSASPSPRVQPPSCSASHQGSVSRLGWRIPFCVGGALALAFLLYYRLALESPMCLASEKSRAPLQQLLSGAHLGDLAQVFMMMSGFWWRADGTGIARGGAVPAPPRLGLRQVMPVSNSVQLADLLSAAHHSLAAFGTRQ